jgi:hypothetical protein
MGNWCVVFMLGYIAQSSRHCLFVCRLLSCMRLATLQTCGTAQPGCVVPCNAIAQSHVLSFD